VYINKEQYFEGVPPEVWQFQVGGYQVCEKWLRDRRRRVLSGIAKGTEWPYPSSTTAWDPRSEGPAA